MNITGGWTSDHGDRCVKGQTSEVQERADEEVDR